MTTATQTSTAPTSPNSRLSPILAQYRSTRAYPSYGKGAVITVDAKAYSLDGQAPYFSVTAEVTTPASRRRDDVEMGGTCHPQVLRFWPKLAPVVALHLSDALTGAPMHALANGWHWAAKAAGIPARYGPEQSAEECLHILADHLRISPETALALVEALKTSADPKAAFASFVEAQAERWAREAQEGLALLRELTARQVQLKEAR